MIETELVNASSTDDILSNDFRMQNSILIPAEFIQQRSSIAGRYGKFSVLLIFSCVCKLFPRH